MKEQKFEFNRDRAPYLGKLFALNLIRKRLTGFVLNGGNENIFVWYPELITIRAIDDTDSTLPDSPGLEISRKIMQAGIY
jgi:hypothetical protein